MAEADRLLTHAFVATTDFEELRANRCDLITGIKGSGKSALLIMSMAKPPEATDLILAQPLRGPVIYETDFPAHLDNDSHIEDYFLDRWLLHSALLVAYATLNADESGRIAGTLADAGLPIDEHESEIGCWISSGRLMRNVSIDNQTIARNLFSAAASVLRIQERHAWIMFDRLDDVTFIEPATEQAVLRGLLRAHIYLMRLHSEISSKLFLRSDILDRATLKSGVRNLDKVSTLKLNMNARDICLLICRRFLQSGPFSLLFPGLRAESLRSDEELTLVMGRILPAGASDRKRPTFLDLYGGLFHNATDATGLFSPRNVLAYLRFALVQQRRINQDGRNQHLFGDSPVLSQAALHQAWIQLSDNRLHSYVYAEFPNTRAFVERLDRGPSNYPNIAALAERLFGESTTALNDTKTIVETLEYCGVLRAEGETLWIGRVYRPALRIRNWDRKPTSKRARKR